MNGFAFSGKNVKRLYEKKVDVYLNSVTAVVSTFLRRLT